MKYIKTFEYQNKELPYSKQTKRFVSFVNHFIIEALKEYNERYSITFNSNRINGYLAYYFRYEIQIKNYANFSKSGRLFEIDDLKNYFRFKLDSSINKKYNLSFIDITDNLADILFFIDDTIKEYDDGQQFGISTKHLPILYKKLTIENLEIYKNAKLYNL